MQYFEIEVGQHLKLVNLEGLKRYNRHLEEYISDHHMCCFYSQDFLDDMYAVLQSGDLKLIVSEVDDDIFRFNVPSECPLPVNSLWFDVKHEAQFFEPADDVEVKCEELLDINPILHVAAAAPQRTSHYVLGKLMEEVGEVARAVNQPDRVDEPLCGEIADALISSIDLLYVNLQNSEQYSNVHPSDLRCIVVDLINDQIKKKCTKWASKVL